MCERNNSITSCLNRRILKQFRHVLPTSTLGVSKGHEDCILWDGQPVQYVKMSATARSLSRWGCSAQTLGSRLRDTLTRSWLFQDVALELGKTNGEMIYHLVRVPGTAVSAPGPSCYARVYRYSTTYWSLAYSLLLILQQHTISSGPISGHLACDSYIRVPALHLVMMTRGLHLLFEDRAR